MNNIVKTQNAVEHEELSDEQQKWINIYAQNGNDEIENENFEHAIGWFSKALEVIPEPKDKWEATGWLSASIGDACYYLQNYEEGISNLKRAYDVYGPEDANPFVLLRLGQCYFHLGEEEKAKDCLLQAYMLEGREMFDDEPLYFDFLKSKTKLQD
ncbi:tetratricopeptide repeat protein [Pedobacter immunditicola]|uniref:tetratricopeptide repeat protein n=1 Tax=Pedobacter immunditicola TaxID=3133440 RepID=UPI0030B4C458